MLYLIAFSKLSHLGESHHLTIKGTKARECWMVCPWLLTPNWQETKWGTDPGPLNSQFSNLLTLLEVYNILSMSLKSQKCYMPLHNNCILLCIVWEKYWQKSTYSEFSNILMIWH